MLTSILTFLVALQLAQQPIGTINPSSTREQVQAVLGEPTKTKENFWYYGTSFILFDTTGNLIGYVEGNTDLRVIIPVNTDEEVPTFLQRGSTKEDVARLLGAPTVFGPLSWSYGTSKISFNKDGIATWFDQGNPRLPLEPKAKNEPFYPVTYDESGTPVLSLKGEPSGGYFSPFELQPAYPQQQPQYYSRPEQYGTPPQSTSSNRPAYSQPGELPVLDGRGAIAQETGRARTQYVEGYTRKDGVKVRGYYRSPAQR